MDYRWWATFRLTEAWFERCVLDAVVMGFPPQCLLRWSMNQVKGSSGTGDEKTIKVDVTAYIQKLTVLAG